MLWLTEPTPAPAPVDENRDVAPAPLAPPVSVATPPVERDLYQYQRDEQLDDDDPYVDLTAGGVRAVVRRTADAAAERTGDDDFQDVSSHDLRRRFAQRLLVDHGMNPRVVMEVGGWSSFGAIEPYLNAPTEEVVNDAFDSVDL